MCFIFGIENRPSHFHMAQIANNGMGLQSLCMILHPLKASRMEGKEILLKPKWAARFCQIMWDWGQRRKMCKLLSVFDLQKGKMAGPHQFLFWRFSRVRFLLWTPTKQILWSLRGNLFSKSMLERCYLFTQILSLEAVGKYFWHKQTKSHHVPSKWGSPCPQREIYHVSATKMW